LTPQHVPCFGSADKRRLPFQVQRRKKMKTQNIDGLIQKSVSYGDSAPLVSEDYVYPIAVIISISFLAFALSGGIQL